MDDLADRIRASLENPNSEPWFPELTCDLAAQGWERLRQDIGLTPESYSTERVLSRSLSTPREIVAFLKTCPRDSITTQMVSIETLRPTSILKYQAQGVSFYPGDEILHSTILSCIEDAIALINQVPSLMETVSTLVRSLHILKPVDADHDVSFSEPHVPFSIFVSVPDERTKNDALRVAEAIVHEAMHLQLTLIERAVGLAVASSKQFFSPWKGEFREVQGVLHALYVFRVIDQFLKALISIQEPTSGSLSYFQSRRREIDLQVSTIRDFEDSPGLTKPGGALAKSLISDW